jgi:hypothetical protein
MDVPQPANMPVAGDESKPQAAWRLWLTGMNLLSLDAPIVSVIWARLFSDSLGIRLLPGVYPVLFCAVWSIYILDRLLDTMPIRKAIPTTARHRFFRRHWHSMFLLGILASATGAWQAITVAPAPLIGSGILLSVLVAGYFLARLAQHHIVSVLATVYLGFIVLVILMFIGLHPWATFLIAALLAALALRVLLDSGSPHSTPREVLCGMLFAAGTAMPAYWHISDSVFPFGSEMFAIPVEMLTSDVLLFGLLCALNCIGISIWEKHADANGEDTGAVAQYFPGIEKGYIPLLLSLVVVALLWNTNSNRLAPGPLRISMSLSAIGLTCVHAFRTRLSSDTLRVLGDAALLSPLAVFPLI